MNLVDGRLRRKEKASTKPVVHSSIGSFGRGVQLPPISTKEKARSVLVKELLALFYTTPLTIFTTTAEELRAKVRAKQQKLIYGTNWYIQLTGIMTNHKMCGNAQYKNVEHTYGYPKVYSRRMIVQQNLVTTQIVTAIITTLAQIATLVVVIIYTVYTARMTSAAKTSADAANQTINEMKEARDQENAPYIVVYFDLPINKHLIYLVIKNVGKSIAEEVKLTFTPSLSSTVFKGINDVPLIKNGISSIPPNYEIRTLFDGVIPRFGKTDLPLTYAVEVSYLGGLAKNRRASTQILDLSTFYGLMSVREKDIDDLVKAVEDIAKHTDKINDNLEEVSESLTSGIWVKNPMLPVSAQALYPTSWGDSVITKLKEFQFLWKSTQSKEDERFINPFLSDLQNKIILIGEQIIVILSASPPSTPKVLIDNIGNIVAKLSDLGRKRFYMDGGRSTNEFNTLGDEIAKNIEDVIGQIQSVNFSLADNKEVFD